MDKTGNTVRIFFYGLFDSPIAARGVANGGESTHQHIAQDVARTRRHQRDHRNRPHCQRPAGAEQRIEHQRQDRGIEADNWRQSREQGIGKTLRDQHDGDDHRRHQVAG